jgi:hypothetical protein
MNRAAARSAASPGPSKGGEKAGGGRRAVHSMRCRLTCIAPLAFYMYKPVKANSSYYVPAAHPFPSLLRQAESC